MLYFAGDNKNLTATGLKIGLLYGFYYGTRIEYKQTIHNENVMIFKPRVFLFLHARFEPKYACLFVCAWRCNLMHCVGLINCTKQFE
jgi:hypothetical protein